MASDAGKTDELESSHHPGTNGGGGLCAEGPPGGCKQIYRKRPWVAKDGQSMRQDEEAQDLRFGEVRQGAIRGARAGEHRVVLWKLSWAVLRAV